MKVIELIELLSKFPRDTNLVVSVDMSHDESDMDSRCYGDVYSAQDDGEFVTILAECGSLNYGESN